MIHIAPEVAKALAAREAVVALESTLVTHGLPWPENFETATKCENAVRAHGATPATIAVLNGVPTVGISLLELEELARSKKVIKAGRRDIGPAIASGRSAGTTVSATAALAETSGISIFATGGIGGVHRKLSPGDPLDISSDLYELARTSILVVSAGAKSILDLPQTVELMETLGIPIVGYRTDEFPAFYTRGSGGSVSARVESPEEAARAFAAHRHFSRSAMLLVQPPDETLAIPDEEFQAALQQAEAEAARQSITGGATTPFLLAELARLTAGRTLIANRALIEANARLAAEVALALARECRRSDENQ